MCWHRSGFPFPWTDLHVLVSRCLLQVSAYNRTLSMHDQLQEFAHRAVQGDGLSITRRNRLLGREAAAALGARVRDQFKCAAVLLAEWPQKACKMSKHACQ